MVGTAVFVGTPPNPVIDASEETPPGQVYSATGSNREPPRSDSSSQRLHEGCHCSVPGYARVLCLPELESTWSLPISMFTAFCDQPSGKKPLLTFPSVTKSMDGFVRPRSAERTRFYKNIVYLGFEVHNWVIRGSLHSPEGVRFFLHTEVDDEVDIAHLACRGCKDEWIR